MKTNNRSGFTLVELILYMAISAFVILWVSPAISRAWQTNFSVKQEYDQRTTYQAMDVFVNDMRQSTSQTVAWSAITRGNGNFDIKLIPWFTVTTNTSGGTSYVCYHYDDANQGLVRLHTAIPPSNSLGCDDSDAPTGRQLVARNILPPTDPFPLFETDTTGNHVVICRLRIARAGANGDSMIMSRRVSSRG